MGCTVAELFERISSAEFSEWQAFYRDEPFGFETEFRGFAMIAMILANIYRGKDSRAYTIEDFMPRLRQDQTPKQQLQIAKLWQAAFEAEANQEAENG